ncbi:hypothetical protein L6452_35243 [Arctium lappa]|uniref:Uncharacterized protein n=1 Tax=Arctium lappa TaxID=4217 RepID=A0ACB8Y552_ARCLA|nr:hypothetical protein L6452_35243 [Arctium lappa]
MRSMIVQTLCLLLLYAHQYPFLTQASRVLKIDQSVISSFTNGPTSDQHLEYELVPLPSIVPSPYGPPENGFVSIPSVVPPAYGPATNELETSSEGNDPTSYYHQEIGIVQLPPTVPPTYGPTKSKPVRPIFGPAKDGPSPLGEGHKPTFL